MKKRNKVRKNILYALVFVLAAIGILSPAGLRAEEKRASILLDFEGISGVEFRLYQVAVSDGQDGFTLLGDFKNYSVDLTDSQAAATLKAYVERDMLAPLQTQTTDPDGRLSFADLSAGHYLILADNFVKDSKSYQMNPILLSAPGLDEKTQKPVWDLAVKAKYQAAPLKSELSVRKIWKDSKSSDRPKSILVELTKDGVVEDEIRLSEENQWTYTWKNLEASSAWAVVEKEVPDGYKVSISDQDTGSTYVIVNTTDTPPDTPPNSPPHTPPHLPQTGQLWWPVGIMLCAGMLCIIIGVRVGRRKD